MRVLLAQMKPEFDVGKNVERLIKILDNSSADLYVFPELYLTGYLIRDEIVRNALDADSKVMRKIAKHSYGRTVIFGFPERSTSVYNSAAIIHNGEVHVARKIYLPNFGPFEEHLYFKEGTEPFIIETEHGKIGVQICYDAFFPEIAKYQALKGAEIIVNISASPITSRRMFETIIPARAIENTVFFIYVNWAGLQRTMEFWGGSMVYSPRGVLLRKSPYFEESVDVMEIDPGEVEIARRLRPTLRDTRQEVLQLLSQYPGNPP